MSALHSEIHGTFTSNTENIIIFYVNNISALQLITHFSMISSMW